MTPRQRRGAARECQHRCRRYRRSNRQASTPAAWATVVGLEVLERVTGVVADHQQGDPAREAGADDRRARRRPDARPGGSCASARLPARLVARRCRSSSRPAKRSAITSRAALDQRMEFGTGGGSGSAASQARTSASSWRPLRRLPSTGPSLPGGPRQACWPACPRTRRRSRDAAGACGRPVRRWRRPPRSCASTRPAWGGWRRPWRQTARRAAASTERSRTPRGRQCATGEPECRRCRPSGSSVTRSGAASGASALGAGQLRVRLAPAAAQASRPVRRTDGGDGVHRVVDRPGWPGPAQLLEIVDGRHGSGGAAGSGTRPARRRRTGSNGWPFAASLAELAGRIVHAHDGRWSRPRSRPAARPPGSPRSWPGSPTGTTASGTRRPARYGCTSGRRSQPPTWHSPGSPRSATSIASPAWPTT